MSEVHATGLSVLMLVPVALYLMGILLAAWHKRWGFLTALLVVPAVALTAAGVIVGFLSATHEVRPGHVAETNVRALTAEVVSDDELQAIASAEPQIDLEDAVDDDKNLARHPERPSWVNGDIGDNQQLIVSGPFTAQDSCEVDAEKQLSKWLYERLGYLETKDVAFYSIGLDLPQIIKSQYHERRDTSVGEMHFLYTLAEVTPEYERQISESLAKHAAQVTRKRGVRVVSFAGAGVLGLVAIAHGMLRAGGKKKSNATV